jgi:hypothetical protein
LFGIEETTTKQKIIDITIDSAVPGISFIGFAHAKINPLQTNEPMKFEYAFSSTKKIKF